MQSPESAQVARLTSRSNQDGDWKNIFDLLACAFFQPIAVRVSRTFFLCAFFVNHFALLERPAQGSFEGCLPQLRVALRVTLHLLLLFLRFLFFLLLLLAQKLLHAGFDSLPIARCHFAAAEYHTQGTEGDAAQHTQQISMQC